MDVVYTTVGSSAGIENANAALYLLVAVGMSIFFLYTTIKIIVSLLRLGVSTRSSSSLSSTTSDRVTRRKTGYSHLLRTAIKLSITGVSLLILVIGALLFAVARDFAFKAIPWVVIWLILHSAANLKAISSIIAFSPKRLQPSSVTKTADYETAPV